MSAGERDPVIASIDVRTSDDIKVSATLFRSGRAIIGLDTMLTRASAHLNIEELYRWAEAILAHREARGTVTGGGS